MIDRMTRSQTPAANAQPAAAEPRGDRRVARVGRPRRVASAALAAILALTALPGTVRADATDDTGEARLEGYKDTVTLQGGQATTGTWMLFFALAAVGCAAMFKDAKRSHLD